MEEACLEVTDLWWEIIVEEVWREGSVGIVEPEWPECITLEEEIEKEWVWEEKIELSWDNEVEREEIVERS